MTEGVPPQHGTNTQPRPEPTMTNPPLDRSTVLDLSDEPLIIAGRYLADLGARVIRIESAHGDYIRRTGPWLDGTPGNERALRHLLYNQGKESLALDLSDPAAWELIEQMSNSADIIIAPIEQHEVARDFFAGLGQRAASGSGPSLIDVVFRREHPEQQATDLIAMAAGSQLVCNGFPDLPPDYPVGKLGYKQASYLATVASVSSIFQQARGGASVHATISLQEAVASTIIQAANPNLYLWHGMVAERTGTGGLALSRRRYRSRFIRAGQLRGRRNRLHRHPGNHLPHLRRPLGHLPAIAHQHHLEGLPRVVRRGHRRRSALARTLDGPDVPRRAPRRDARIHRALLRRATPRRG